jgi:hypothetical protein
MAQHYLVSTATLEVSRSYQLPNSGASNIHIQRFKNTHKMSDRTAERPPKYLQNALQVRQTTG